MISAVLADPLANAVPHRDKSWPPSALSSPESRLISPCYSFPDLNTPVSRAILQRKGAARWQTLRNSTLYVIGFRNSYGEASVAPSPVY
ncbi:hypothetical protein TNCV_4028861 [Trichonephila clavipes]|nr:hypothetical protein TNCV_4028861 [Trichonephila clavipes]